jgi:hypothetical protein
MDLIQLRIHPSMGMARIGQSKDWYFLGPEIPRFLQEQYPNLRHAPSPLRHPATANPAAVQPDQGNYRDKSDKKQIMPQAARFRVFAYIYNGEERDPYKVVEVTSADADIEWKVELANVKSVKMTADGKKVDPNKPEGNLSTKSFSPTANSKDCQVGSLPNLAWLKLETEKDAALLANQQPATGAEGKPTGRLHVIGNEGNVNGGALKTKSGDLTLTGEYPFLYQDEWYDSAADGPVQATVELHDSFTQRFPDAKYLVPRQKDPLPLPPDKKVEALSAWVVVNLPDYLPDMGHFVSLWDLALSQAWLYVAFGDATPVVGQHHLAVSPREVVTYGFYDYYLHIHPQLGLFSDLAYVSGQARAGSGSTPASFTTGNTVRGKLSADSGGGSIKIAVSDALRIKAASLGQFPFSVLLTQDTADPLATGQFELLSCSKAEVVGDAGVLTVTGMHDTWAAGIPYFAGTKAGFIETPLLKSIDQHETTLTIDVEAAHRMPQPTPLGRDSPFKLALSTGSSIEWVTCTENAKILGWLTVTRGQDGTTAREWVLGSEVTTVIAPAMGHKTLDARAHADEFDRDKPEGTQAWIRDMLFPRLRLPTTLYDRLSFKKHDHAKLTGYPREFGRRMDFDKVSGGADSGDPDFSDALNVDPCGSLARYHNIFAQQRQLACRGKSLPLDRPHDELPAKLPGEKYDESPETHIRWLDDYYWIVSGSDMPMVKDHAFTAMQYGQFKAWAEGHESKRLFEALFRGSDLESFFKASPGSSIESYLNEMLKKRPRFAPAFLDMASMGKMLGGSFLPGIEVGREAGKRQNWSLYRGGTPHFPDLRFHPQGKSDEHRAGTLTKDLSVPWFADYIDCAENFWPTSRPQVVFDEKGIAYSWLDLGVIKNDLSRRLGAASHGPLPAWDVLSPDNPTADQTAFKEYWTRVGFIRRQQDGKLAEEEALLHRP